MFWIVSNALFAALLVAARVSSSPQDPRASRAIPCDHPLRLTRPEYFTHCPTECTYNEWSAWESTGQTTATSKDKCQSEKYFTQKRVRTILTVVGDASDCTLEETRRICEPTNEERLILGLGLGGSGNDYTLVTTSITISPSTNTLSPSTNTLSKHNITSFGGHLVATRQARNSGTRCPAAQSGDMELCRHLRASAQEQSFENEININVNVPLATKLNEYSDDLPSDDEPIISFDWKLHGHRYRRNTQRTCGDDDVQHVLFVLDSSGSISTGNFQKMKDALAKLVPLFCKKIKVALINFSTDIKLEFCFDCFGNDLSGRSEGQNAISNAQYQGRMTHTGATAKCICEDILQPSCGITTDPDCLDVVFITDGKSNDPQLEVCEEIKCLHNKLGIDTFAIGIGGYNQQELDCITHSTDAISAFDYPSFTEFFDSIKRVEDLLLEDLFNGISSCSARDLTKLEMQP